MSDLVKRWVCGALEEEVWMVWVVGEAWMTPRETLCCSLTSGHWEKTCALHHPQLESCLDSAWKQEGWMKINKSGKKNGNVKLVILDWRWERIRHLKTWSPFGCVSPFDLPEVKTRNKKLGLFCVHSEKSCVLANILIVNCYCDMTLLDFRFSYTSLCSKKGHPHQEWQLWRKLLRRCFRNLCNIRAWYCTHHMTTTIGNAMLGSFSEHFDEQRKLKQPTSIH